jgi:hypothetical protein
LRRYLGNALLSLGEDMEVLAVVLGGYAATSYFFLKNPHLLHKLKRFSPAKLIAHRGGAGEG